MWGNLGIQGQEMVFTPEPTRYATVLLRIFFCALMKTGCLVAAQNFEYKISCILDKPTESVFGYISVLVCYTFEY